MKDEKEYIATVKDDGRLDVPRSMVRLLGKGINFVRVEKKRHSIYVWRGADYSYLSSPVASDGRVRIKKYILEHVQLYPGYRARITIKDGAIRIIYTTRTK